MKTNLKNFPDVLQPKPTIEGCLEYAKMINEWLEAFEKELREDWHCTIEAELNQFKKQHPHRLLTFDDVYSIVSKFVNNVLGDEV